MAERACGCRGEGVVINEARHAAWHKQIGPLQRGDLEELEAAYGRPSIPEHTYVDDQFVAARRKSGGPLNGPR